MRNDNSYLLRTYCATFNHENYILDALKGFAMQQTTFPVVYTIVDDASTDGTAAVIKQFIGENFDLSDTSVGYDKDMDYGHVTFAQHKTNENCFFAVIYLKENHYSQKKSKAPYLTEWMDSKYIALCEGDDYWTDPLKLQKQVDFLEEHSEYSLCCHRYTIYKQNDGTWSEDYVKKLFEKQPEGFSFGNKENLNEAWITKTMTLVYRLACKDEEELKKYKYRCDEHLCYHLLKNGLGFCFPFVGAVYRRCDSGVFSVLSVEQKMRRWCLIRDEMLSRNICDKELRDCVYTQLRRSLFNGERCKETKTVVWTCLKSFYHTEGLKATLVIAKKFLGSYVRGFGKKYFNDN